MRRSTGLVALKNSIRQKQILKLFFDSQTDLSVSEICRSTQYSHPVVHRHIDELKQRKLVLDAGQGASSGGKPPAVYRLNSELHSVLGINAGPQIVNLVLIDISYRILREETIPNDHFLESTAGLNSFAMKIGEFLQASGHHQDKLLGIGIGLIRAFESPFVDVPQLEKERIHSELGGILEYPLRVGREWDQSVHAESTIGLAKGQKYPLIVNLGWGISVGMMIGGEKYAGFRGHAGDIGHIQVDPAGDLCYCGKIGCLETLASGHALSKMAKEAIRSNHPTLIKSLVGGESERINEGTIVRAAELGDDFSIKLLERAGFYIGDVLASTIKVLDPQSIIITGSLSEAKQFILNPIQTSIERNVMYYTRDDPIRIHVSGLGHQSVAIGSAVPFIKDLYQLDSNEKSLIGSVR